MPIQAGQPAPDFHLTDVSGTVHTLADYRGKPLLLMLYRSPDCALCSLRLYQMGLVYPRLHTQGLAMLAVFEAEVPTVQKLTRRHALPFPLVADPLKRMFAQYDVRASWWGLRGTLRLGDVWQAWRRRVPGTLTTGQIHQLPAEMFIGPEGSIQVAHYGKDTGDFLSLADLDAQLAVTMTAMRHR